MPELPEVEVTRLALQPGLVGHTIIGVNLHDPRLRTPVDPALGSILKGQRVLELGRRGKYLLVHLELGTLIVHLGMSGRLRLFSAAAPPRERHDHVELLLAGGATLRYHDPRRFGQILWWPTAKPPPAGLSTLGPEPFDPAVTAGSLHRQSRGRNLSIKAWLLSGQPVVGVGNIYACESLFEAGIDPRRAVGRISERCYERLLTAIRTVLSRAIQNGGSTLRDFLDSQGNSGYFQQQHRVYDRTGQPCPRCGQPVRHRRQGQRSTWFCAFCQH